MALSADDLARYGRQILLPHVGIEGQERVAVATAALDGPGLDSEIARRYLERAGVGRITPGAVAEGLAPPWMRHEAPRAVLAGSRAALAAFRAALAAAGKADGEARP